MGYSDQKYYDRPLIKVAAAIAFGTATATGTASNSLVQPAATQLQTFLRRTKITGLQISCVTAPGGTQVGPINLQVLNGTNVAGQIAVQTATVGQVFVIGGDIGTSSAVTNGTTSVTGTLTQAELNGATAGGTGSPEIYAVGTGPTSALVGTFTASGATSGTWDLWLQVQERPEDDSL